MKILLAICAYCGLLALGVLIGKWLKRNRIRLEIRHRIITELMDCDEPQMWAEYHPDDKDVA